MRPNGQALLGSRGIFETKPRRKAFPSDRQVQRKTRVKSVGGRVRSHRKPMRGFRATRLASHRLALPPLRTTQRITLMAPTISSLRMSHCPILLTAPSRVLPPVDLCRGTKPSQAAKLRPLSKVDMSGAKAAMAPAVTNPRNRTQAAQIFVDF